MEGFEGLDINDMFNEAAGAAEQTGEKDPSSYSKNPPKEINKLEKKAKILVEEEAEVEEPIIIEPVVEVETKEEIKEVKKSIPINKPSKSNVRAGQIIDINSINKIIEMKEILDSYSPTELQFVVGYFQKEDYDEIKMETTFAEVIHEALTVEQRGLDALNKIVIARGYNAAERAFYLMGLDNNSIEAIYEQITILSEELDCDSRVNDRNKIQICRTLEKAISEMVSELFDHINKLQEFTNTSITTK